MRFLLLLGGALSGGIAQGDGDPYEPIRTFTLENGLVVRLAPSGAAKTVEVELRFEAGWGAENRSKQGVARLTERAFLREGSRTEGLSLPQRVRESGGEASGTTTASYTAFNASVPSIRGIWVLNEYATLLTQGPPSPEAVERAKGELLLELGEPQPWLTSFLEGLLPNFQKGPDFFQTEFKVHNPSSVDSDQLRKNLNRLKIDDVRAFWSNYYRASNAVLMVAGPFKQEATLAFIRETFEGQPLAPRIEAPTSTVTPRTEPYFRSKVAERDSRVSIGTKFWNISADEEMALRIYFEYLAARLTKRLRNHHGQSYGAESTLWVDSRRFGYALVTFQTPRRAFEEDLDYTQKLLRRETLEGDLSDDNVEAAREAYRGYMELISNDAETMARLTARLHTFQTTYRTDLTPYQVYQRLEPERFRQQLRGLFHPRKGYLSLEEPPLYSRNESTLIYLIAMFLSVQLCRMRFLRKFDYTTIRYVRKVKYQPIVTALLAAGFVGTLWIASQVAGLLNLVAVRVPTLQSTFLLSQYLPIAVGVFLLVAGALSYLRLIPRKLILTETHLIIKSISYYSHPIEMRHVRDIAVCRPHQLFTHHLWTPRTWVAHWTPWKKGLLIRLENGSAYYLGFRDAAVVAEELRAIIKAREPLRLPDAA